MLELLAVSVFPGTIAAAGTMDLLTMTIPNRISIAMVAGFFIVAPLAGLGLTDIAIHTATCLAMLGVGVFMFWREWIGGGDAKLFAATSLWFGYQQLGELALMTAMLGGVLTIALLLFRKLPLPAFMDRLAWIHRLHQQDTGVPYGIAIAAAALILYPAIPWVETYWF